MDVRDLSGSELLQASILLGLSIHKTLSLRYLDVIVFQLRITLTSDSSPSVNFLHSVFQCLSQVLNFCLNFDSLEAFFFFLHFHFLSSSRPPDLTHDYLAAFGHEMTTRTITYEFLFPIQSSFFFIKRKKDIS